jgi:hypothetical protein
MQIDTLRRLNRQVPSNNSPETSDNSSSISRGRKNWIGNVRPISGNPGTFIGLLEELEPGKLSGCWNGMAVAAILQKSPNGLSRFRIFGFPRLWQQGAKMKTIALLDATRVVGCQIPDNPDDLWRATNA